MPFSANHESRSRMIQLLAPPGRVFPLFEPVGEREWAADWEPEFLYPRSGAAEVGAVFTTRHPGEADTIWTITAHDPARFHLTYLRVTPGSCVGLVDIGCDGAPDGTTHAAVTYAFTALGEAGNNFLAGFTEEHYQAYMASWETAINYFLRHGHRYEHHAHG
jgi:hypothetical protein